MKMPLRANGDITWPTHESALISTLARTVVRMVEMTMMSLMLARKTPTAGRPSVRSGAPAQASAVWL